MPVATATTIRRSVAAKENGLRKSPLVLIRSAMADRWFPTYREAIWRALVDQVLAVAMRAREGQMRGVTDRMEAIWLIQLERIKQRFLYGMTSAGYELASGDFADLRGKASAVPPVDVGRDAFTFIQRHTPQDIDRWLAETSRLETAVSRKKLDKIFRDAVNYWDKDKRRGLTPAQMSKQITAKGLAASRHRANLIARTGTQWSYNEGAHQMYRDAGVQVEEWFVTADDRLCPFCESMDGKKVRTSDPFWSQGDTMGVKVPLKAGGASERTLDFPFAIQHPPLHPMCRCVLLPVIVAPPAVQRAPIRTAVKPPAKAPTMLRPPPTLAPESAEPEAS